MGHADPHAVRAAPQDNGTRTAFLVVDSESVPDGRLLAEVKYPGENLSPEAAVERARAEAREHNRDGSDFIPVSFHVPVSVCLLRVGPELELLNFKCLDAPQYRPREIVNQFWFSVGHYKAKLVTFNGRGFDLPLMELAAFRHGICAGDYYQSSRNRFNGPIDLMDWMTNFGASRLTGGLNLLAKLLGLPGKMGVSGEHVYQMYREGKVQEINDYCLCDTLDTYFVFLRTRVLTGDITSDQEASLVARAKDFLRAKAGEFPVLARYLATWTSLAAA